MSQLDDRSIRNFLISNQIPSRSFISRYRIIEELNLCLGAARIDIAIVNGSTWGIEIKGETDNLNRLPNQIQVYSKIFDYIEIVCTKNHLTGVKKIVPKYWGIIMVAEENGVISCKQVRQPQKNMSKEMSAVVQLLWKHESLNFLESFYSSKGVKSKDRSAIWNRIVEISEESKLYSYVSDCLRNRKSWKLAQQL